MRSASATATGLWIIFLQAFFAGANVVRPSQQQRAAPDTGIVLEAAALAHVQQDATPTLLQFPLYHVDDSYLISVDNLPLTGRDGSCSQENLANTTINGQSLQYFPTGFHRQGGQEISASLFGNVIITNQQSHEPHTVTLFLDAICEDVRLNRPERHSTFQGHSRTFVITIADIDRVPWTEQGFDVYRDVNGVEIVKLVVRGLQAWPGPEWDDTKDTADESDVVELADTAIEEEIGKLRALKDELRAIQHSVEHQTALVKNLEQDAYVDSGEPLKDCKGVTCVLKTLYRKSKNCIHLAYLHLKEAGLGSASPSCHDMSSMPEPPRAKVLMNSNSKCSGRYCGHRGKMEHSSDDYTPLLADVKEDDSSVSSGLFSTDFGGQRQHSAQHKIHHAFAILASILCLGCLTTVLHRRCCSPRARADRAARREERRTRRQYRCAARKKAWREWWERQPWCFGRCRNSSLRRIQDYEEKRALILQQEAVLECAMQHEIGILQNSGHPGVVRQVMTMAEEGRLTHASSSMPPRLVGDSTGSEALPAYRSRSSSGRPPSYNEFDENAIADGFTNYTPSSSANDEVSSVRSFASGRTPESSVVELSPRQSSETLRTERSAL